MNKNLTIKETENCYTETHCPHCGLGQIRTIQEVLICNFCGSDFRLKGMDESGYSMPVELEGKK